MKNSKHVVSRIMAYAMIIVGPLSAHAAEPTVQEHVIEITGFKFVPESITAKSGDTITWVNRDIVPHTATSRDGTWTTGTLNQDESKSFVVSLTMESSYFCQFHINMVGSISIVGDANSNRALEQRKDPTTTIKKHQS